jgi:hypothetical protein
MTASALTAAELPVTRVTVFSSGVACYQRDGKVSGDATVELRFKTEQINDILKSLVLQDLDGGAVSTVTYASRDPIDKALGSFAVDLTGRPSLAQLLDQLRGAGVEVTAPQAGQSVVGTIVGVEPQTKVINETSVTEYVLNVLSDDGLRGIVLTPGQRIRLTDEKLDAELRQALLVLATSHDADKKTVTLSFTGAGERRVQAAYLLEAPLWKTSYRLVLSEQNKPFLQGWAIVENTTDDDWNDVSLSLVSGRPISFIQDLYQPLYVPRPVVRPELYASLTPQTYGGAMDDASKEEADMAEAPMMQMRDAARSSRRGRFAGDAAAAPPMAAPSMEMIPGEGGGVTSAASAEDVGELFAYDIEAPVTLPRQKSAMLPIVTGEVAAEKVSIYNPAVHAKHPLNGLLLKNTTDLHLMQGPITVFDANTYAGDARLDDIQPGERRLLSYAMDLACEAEMRSPSGTSETVSMRIARGTLYIKQKYTDKREYDLKNRDDKPRSVIVEQPMPDDWKLVEPKEPFERAREVYRFRTEAPAGEKSTLNVVFEREGYETVALASVGLDPIGHYLRSKVISKEVKAALEKLVQMRQALEELNREVAARETEIREITTEQGRIRENMKTAPQDSDLFARLLKKLDDQETRLEKLNGELSDLRARQQSKQKEMEEFLLGLEVE